MATDVLVFEETGDQQQSRPAIAATFEETATGEEFTVVVNHFKSKSGEGTGADADQGDGQGAFNATRTRPPFNWRNGSIRAIPRAISRRTASPTLTSCSSAT